MAGHPFDPMLAAVYKRLGAADFGEALGGELFLNRVDDQLNGIVVDTEGFRRSEEPWHSSVIFARPLGDSVLRRGEQGELFVEDASGQRTEWVPASCRADILHVDVEREQLLVVCTARGSALELHGARVHQSLGVSVEPEGKDSLDGEPTLLFPVTPASTAEGTPSQPTQSVVNLEKRTVHPMPVPGEVQYTEGTRALVLQRTGPEQRTRTLWFVDIATGEQRELGEQTEYGLEVAGPFVHAAGLLVDMRTGQRVGTVEGDVAALDSRGRVLRSGGKLERQAPVGPFQWTPITTPR